MQKNDIARQAYMVTVLRTGSDKFGQVWTSQNRCEALFFLNRESHAVQIWPSPQTYVQFSNRTSLNTTTLRSGGNSTLSHFSRRKVWTGVKCNFSLAHHQVRNVIGKLSISRVRMWNFTSIGPKTKSYGFRYFRHEGHLSNPASDHPKKVWTATFLGRNSTSHTALESCPSRTFKYAVSALLAKR